MNRDNIGKSVQALDGDTEFLAYLNDSFDYTFDRIAQVIEENFLKEES